MSKPWHKMTRREQDGRGTATWKRLRASILASSTICWLCGRPGADTVDHVIPIADGGSNDPSNLRPAHGKARPEYGCPGNYGRGKARRPASSSSPRSRAW